ncbi:MAG: MurT ligase domain-containing protein [Firmicutes bacterium]|nr:MurT ligase domain-containing protein [Bacillota bacterium]
MNPRTTLAVFASHMVRLALRILRRGGTAWPGKIAIKLCPDILRRLAKDVETVLVTGTNGKTTSCRLLEQLYIDAGRPYFSNKSGANLIQGITGDFAQNATLLGRPKKRCAVIECDEGASKQVCAYLRPKVMLVTNVFGDQLDRFGDVYTTLENIKIGVQNAPEAILCLNADDSLTASIADEAPNKTVFYGVDTEIYKERADEPSDASHCIRCKTRYEYDYVTYGHLGGFRCPSCGYKRREPDVCVTGILSQGEDAQTVSLRALGEETALTINIPGGYNIYNAAGAVAAALALGFTLDAAKAAAANFERGFGRMEKLKLGGTTVRLILVKNPAGCNQALNYLVNAEGELLYAICLNDQTGDGTDVSWIWDVHFEQLCTLGARLKEVFVAGARADDMAMRLKYAGLPPDKLRIVRDYGEMFDRIKSQSAPCTIMHTYTAMMELRDKLSKDYGLKEFWM